MEGKYSVFGEKKRRRKWGKIIFLFLIFILVSVGFFMWKLYSGNPGPKDLDKGEGIAAGQTASQEDSLPSDDASLSGEFTSGDGETGSAGNPEGEKNGEPGNTEGEGARGEGNPSGESAEKPGNSDGGRAGQPEGGTEEDPVLAKAAALLDSMTLEERIYQLFIVTQEQLTGASTVTQSGEITRQAIQKYPVGGIIYLAQNLVSREQCISMVSNIQSYSRIGLFIAVDEEGGTVSRIGKNPSMGTTFFPSMAEIGATEDTSKAYDVGRTTGAEISELGFNLDFAPVADVYSNPSNTVIGTRAFSSDPETAAAMVASCVQGFRDSGMLCTLKHFPGHGDTLEDSHYGEATTDKSLEEMRECEFLPFISGIEAGAQFVMVGHISAPKVDSGNVPATLSKEIVTGLLREELHFEGIIVTDSMAMKAITDRYSSGDAAVKAIQAGVDIILAPASLSAAVDGIRSAVASGEISEERINESVIRVLQLKIQSGIID